VSTTDIQALSRFGPLVEPRPALPISERYDRCSRQSFVFAGHIWAIKGQINLEGEGSMPRLADRRIVCSVPAFCDDSLARIAVSRKRGVWCVVRVPSDDLRTLLGVQSGRTKRARVFGVCRGRTRCGCAWRLAETRCGSDTQSHRGDCNGERERGNGC